MPHLRPKSISVALAEASLMCIKFHDIKLFPNEILEHGVCFAGSHFCRKARRRIPTADRVSFIRSPAGRVLFLSILDNTFWFASIHYCFLWFTFLGVNEVEPLTRRSQPMRMISRGERFERGFPKMSRDTFPMVDWHDSCAPDMGL